jgi:hypothetical protein
VSTTWWGGTASAPVNVDVNGEHDLVRLATDLLVGAGIDRDANVYRRNDQPNAAHGEPSCD